MPQTRAQTTTMGTTDALRASMEDQVQLARKKATGFADDPELDKNGNPIVRTDDGKFVKGKSGNPAGRPKGRKNRITVLKQDLEIAIREQLSEEVIQSVVQSMIVEALNGNVGAGKLILDKVMSNARIEEDEKEHGGGLRVVIENATFESLNKGGDNIIEGKVEESEDE